MLTSFAGSELSKSMETLQLSDENKQRTPCKKVVLEDSKDTPNSNCSLGSSDSMRSPTVNRRISSVKKPLKSVPNLPPIVNKNYSPAAHQDENLQQNLAAAPMIESTPKKEQKPEWNSSLEKEAPSSFAHRVPWTPELRMRKGQSRPFEMPAKVAHSPRTPHVSQLNTKRMKQVSQLSRIPCISETNVPRHDEAENVFAKPMPLQKKLDPKVLQAQVAELRKQLEAMTHEKEQFEQKYLEEMDKRVAAELELTVLKSKLD